MKKFEQFKNLYESGISIEQIKNDLNICARTLRRYINKKDKTIVQPKQLKIKQELKTYNSCKVTFIKTFYNTCINLSGNGFKSISIDNDTEILTTVNNELQHNKIKILDGLTEIDGDKLTIICMFKLFKKTIYLKFRKNKPKADKQIYTIYTCDRNNIIIYQDKFWSVKRCVYVSLGFPDKLPYELRRFCNLRNKSTNKDDGIKKWIVYDIEAIKNKQNIMTPYLIVAIEFDPTGNDDSETVYTFACDDINQVIDSAKNFVVENFREFLFKKLIQSYDSYRNEQETKINFAIFGYNNFRFDDMLINPTIFKAIYHPEQLMTESKILSSREDIDIKQEIGSRNGLLSYSKLFISKKFSEYYNDKSAWAKDETIKCQSAIHFYDLVKWLPDKSLSEACKDYEIGADSKMNFDIVEYNQHVVNNNYNNVTWFDLEEACKIFLKAKKKKESINIDDLKQKTYYRLLDNKINLWELCKEYCLYDCISTKELSKKIYRLVKDTITEYEHDFGIITKSTTMFNYMTPATLAFEFLSKSFAQSKATLKLLINHSEYGKFIHDSYFGGRCDFSFIGKYTTVNGNLRYYDVTSEYPCAMMKKYPVLENTNDIIVGEAIDLVYYQNIIDTMIEKRRVSKKYDDFTIFRPFDEEFNGIFRCNVYPPADNTELITFAPMATRLEKKPLKYENVARKYIIINTSFMKNYIMSGYTVELVEDSYNTVFTNLDYIFAKFIDYFGKAKADSKEELNKTKAKLFKLIINSIAGKLAQKPTSTLKISNTSEQSRTIDTNKIEDWTKSNHYLATFIIAEANFILYSTLYRLQLTNIYNKVPHSDRCGALLYMDTDSIVFDQDLCDKLDWKFEENIGTWKTDLNYFDITWKAKYKKKAPNNIICFGKKSYIIMKDDEILDKKLKGIHGGQMDNMLSDLNFILDGNKKTIKFEGIVRAPIKTTDNFIDINKEIRISTVQKSLTPVQISNVCSITCTNEKVNLTNKNNKLFFCISKYEN